MQTPRWFFVLLVVLAVNVALVLSSSLWHLAVADETVPGDSQVKSQAVDVGKDRVGKDKDATVKDETNNAQQIAENDLNFLPEDVAPALPDSDDNDYDNLEDAEVDFAEISLPAMPEVPSLADRETRENDPLFQEFLNIYSNNTNRESNLQLGVLGGADMVAQSNEYYAALDERLLAANRLTSAARGIAREAARLTQEGKSNGAKQLLSMSIQLRKIAAELLVMEF